MESLTADTSIQRYPIYKDSGVRWLKEIPKHWHCLRMKHLFRDVSIKNRAEAELLSVTQDRGVIPRAMVENRMVMPSGNLETFKFIEQGDFAISLRSFEGGLEYCYNDGIISPAYTVLKAQRKLESAYYKYLFKSYSFISELQTSIVGIREGKNISYEELCYSLIPIPSDEEQTAIASFLDRKTAQIDKAIAQKEKLIELLKERRQILIYKAVTNGLDPNAPMKDSGVKWIGEIPEHWEIAANKTLFEERNERGIENIPILSVSIHTAVSSEEISEEENIRGKIRIEDKSSYKIVRPNDIVFNMMRAWQGAIGAVSVFGMVSPAYVVVKLKIKIVAEYLEYLYRTPAFIEQMNRCSKGITDFRKRLYWNEFKQLVTILPPLQEQKRIVNHINILTEKTNKILDLKKREIEKLSEYKTTLINASVTGKIKMKDWVVKL